MDDKNFTTVEDEIAAMEADERAAAFNGDGDDAEEENDLVLKLSKPYTFEGQTYTEIDLSGLENTTAADLAAVGKLLTRKGNVNPLLEMSLEYAMYMAARVANLPLEFFTRLPSREAMKLKNIVTGFLYGGAGED
jgi:hypothetical protein